MPSARNANGARAQPSIVARMFFAIDAAYAGANRKRVVDRWVAEVLNP